MEIQKFEYLENKKSFLDDIKNIFHSFWRPIIWWKNINLVNNSRHKLLKDLIPFQMILALFQFDWKYFLHHLPLTFFKKIDNRFLWFFYCRWSSAFSVESFFNEISQECIFDWYYWLLFQLLFMVLTKTFISTFWFFKRSIIA